VQQQEWRPRLRALLVERALIHGEITLASGARSSYYFDGKMVTLSAEGLYCAAHCILDALKDDGLDAVGGPPRGADPLVGAVAALSYARGAPLNAFMVRKEPKGHGTGKMIEGPVSVGARVAVVEDVVTTGGSVLQAIDHIEAAGLTVVRVISLVDRLSGARATFQQRGYPFSPLFTVEDLGVVVSA